MAEHPGYTNSSENTEKTARSSLTGNDLSAITDKKQKTQITALRTSYYGNNGPFSRSNANNRPEAFSPGVLRRSYAQRFLDYGNQIYEDLVDVNNLDICDEIEDEADGIDGVDECYELDSRLDRLMHLNTKQYTALLTLQIPDCLNPHPFDNFRVIQVDSSLLIDQKLDVSVTAKCRDMMKAVTPLQPGPLIQLRLSVQPLPKLVQPQPKLPVQPQPRFPTQLQPSPQVQLLLEQSHMNPFVQPQPKTSVQLQPSVSQHAQSLTHEFKNAHLQFKSNSPEWSVQYHQGEQGAPSGVNFLSIPSVGPVCGSGPDLIPVSFFDESGIILTVDNCEPKPELALTKTSSNTPNTAIQHFLNSYGDQPQSLVEGPPRASQQEGELLSASSTSKVPVKDKRRRGPKVVISRSTRRKEDAIDGLSLSSWKKCKNGAPVKASQKKIEKIRVHQHFDDYERPGDPRGQKAIIVHKPTNRCAAALKDACTLTSTSLKRKGKATEVVCMAVCDDYERSNSHSVQSSVRVKEVTHTSSDLSMLEQGERIDFSPTNPQEEAQYGLQSSMEFSKESSLMKLLKACTQKGMDPVICLLGRDVSTDKLFSNKQSSTSPYDNYRPSNSDPSPEDNPTVIGDSMRGPSTAVGPAILTEQHKRTADLVHASHYSEIVECLGEAKDLPSLFIVGVAYFKMSKFAEARRYFNKAQTAAFKENCPGDIMLCDAYLGDIEYTSQSFLSAAEYYKEAIKYYAMGTVASIFKLTPPTLSAIHAKRASSFRNVSKMVEAVHEYRKAIEIATTDRDQLSAHTSLGNLYQSMGENTSALKEYKESIKLAEKLSDHVSLGWAHGNIGNAYLGLGKKDEAISHLQKSLDLAAEYEQTPQAIGRTYNNLGTAYQSMNNLDKAEEYYDLALSQAIYGNDIAGQARVYGNIGNVHMLRKNYERAIPHYGEVLRLSKDPSTISTAQHNRGCAYYEWATFYHPPAISHSRFHGPDCDKDSCLSHMPAKAKELYEKGSIDLEEVVKHHEERFQHIKGSSQGLTLSVSLFESNSRTFHRLQDCLASLHRWEQALVVAEQSRARTLGELMLKKKGIQHLTSPLSFDQIASIVSKQSSPLVYLSYTGARLIGWVFTRCTGKVSMSTFETPLTDDQFEGKSFDYHLRYSLTEELVERSFELYQNVLYNSDSSSPVQRLHELIAAPIIKLLHNNENSMSQTLEVVFILDSYTTLLPLTCLLDKSGSFFGDKYYFKLVPSLLAFGIMGNLLEVQVTLQTDKYDFCVIGDPSIPPFYLNGEVWTLGKLPHARREAEWVAFALHTTPILNENATKTALLNRAMSAKLIHIATHGSASAGFLAFSCFVISTQSGSTKYAPPENVLLYPKEIEDIHISPALVVLSSCDSGRGTVKADGIQGMARAFILAGAQSVLTTLWKVPDESASVFMQFFYQYLMDGIKSSLALHKATLSVRCFAKYSQYIHWSGYQLTGRDVLFSRKESNSVAVLKERLGPSSSFPFLSILKKLEKSLIKNPNLPTDVQVSSFMLVLVICECTFYYSDHKRSP